MPREAHLSLWLQIYKLQIELKNLKKKSFDFGQGTFISWQTERGDAEGRPPPPIASLFLLPPSSSPCFEGLMHRPVDLAACSSSSFYASYGWNLLTTLWRQGLKKS